MSRATCLAAVLLAGVVRAAPSADAEMTLVGGAMKAAAADDMGQLASLLGGASKLKDGDPASVVLARRAVALCGWLQNQGDYGRATKVATWAQKLLKGQKEPDDASRVERLYWESLLLGRYLDSRDKALPLLAEAAKLDPADERISSLQLEFAEAVLQFGK